MSALRAIREKKGFTLAQLASKAGLSARVLIEYEEGRNTIPLAHARLLAKALWVEIEELMPVGGAAPVKLGASSFASGNVSASPSTPLQTPAPPPQNMAQATVAMAYSAGGQQSDNPAPRSVPPRPQPFQAGAERASQRADKPRRPSNPPQPVTEGQRQELIHLAARLEIAREQLEERVGKSVESLTRVEATEWVKRLRAMADEIAPSAKSRFGRWPDGQEDREAVYLAEQKALGTSFTFKLFSGELFNGIISDFTPYTITIADSAGGGEIVLRKLAITYYRSQSGGQSTANQSDGMAQDSAAEGQPAAQQDHAHIDAPIHTPLDLISDRPGDPAVPEDDQMDEDRGA